MRARFRAASLRWATCGATTRRYRPSSGPSAIGGVIAARDVRSAGCVIAARDVRSAGGMDCGASCSGMAPVFHGGCAGGRSGHPQVGVVISPSHRADDAAPRPSALPTVVPGGQWAAVRVANRDAVIGGEAGRCESSVQRRRPAKTWRALRLLRQAAEVEWVSDAADRYRAAVHEAFGIVLRTHVLVEAADLAVREHSAVAARAGPP